MNIYTVRDNLIKTIRGKEAYLAEWKNVDPIETADRIHRATIVGMLKINIDELRRILTDVEICCMNATEASWAGAVDRQGGSFDESELRGRDGWL